MKYTANTEEYKDTIYRNGQKCVSKCVNSTYLSMLIQ